MTVALLVMMVISGVFLLFLVFLQTGFVKSAGSAITGTKDLELFENKKIRGTERWMNIGTWVCVISFISFAIALFVML